jgi:hypothetical protein
MNTTLKLILIIATVFFFIFVGVFVKKRRLSLKFTLIWLASAAVLIALAVFDNHLIRPISNFLGIREPVNALFLAVFCFILLILFFLTIKISNQDEKIRTLAQKIALLEHKSTKIEKK